MSAPIDVTTLAAQHYVGVRRTVKQEEIGATCGEILPRVMGWLQAKGVAATSPPMVVYHAMLDGGGAFDLQPGFFVPEAMEADGDIVPGETAAGDAATVVHEGPYETLGQSWASVHDWIEKEGRSTTAAAWEIYLNDPSREPDPSRLRTRIVVPLDPE